MVRQTIMVKRACGRGSWQTGMGGERERERDRDTERRERNRKAERDRQTERGLRQDTAPKHRPPVTYFFQLSPASQFPKVPKICSVSASGVKAKE
jgi:hypothetical protein